MRNNLGSYDRLVASFLPLVRCGDPPLAFFSVTDRYLPAGWVASSFFPSSDMDKAEACTLPFPQLVGTSITTIFGRCAGCPSSCPSGSLDGGPFLLFFYVDKALRPGFLWVSRRVGSARPRYPPTLTVNFFHALGFRQSHLFLVWSPRALFFL